MVKQVRLDWECPGMPPTTSVLNYADGTSLSSIGGSLGGILDAFEAVLVNTAQVTVQAEVRTINTATGQLTSVESFAPPSPHVGLVDDSAVPNAAMGLLRFSTGSIVNGRRVQGRLFVPGLPLAAVDADGGVLSTMVTTLSNIAADFATAGGFGVWHRPQGGAGGSFHDCIGGTAWDEFAVLRHRR